MSEKIIEKIKNLLDLSNNNPSEEEAIAAAAKAQELMAKYDIQIGDLEDTIDNDIAEEIFYDNGKHEMKKWKVGLASVIAKNFRCKHYFMGKKNIVFYGHKIDAQIALNTFSYLYNAGNKLASNYYYNKKKMGFETKGVMNSYLAGFKNGIQDKLDAQCTALMIVTPKDVTDAFEEMSADWKTTHTKITIYDHDAFEQGKKDGKATMDANRLEVK
jgi:hypothetical protein